MTNKIMELACEAVAFNGGSVQMEAHVRQALAAEVQAQQDYTRAVINERDAYKTSLEATKGEVYRLLSERDAVRKANLDCVDNFNAISADYENLRKEAQMALDALVGMEQNYGNLWQINLTPEGMDLLCDALRKELVQ